jgi:hypothetical protein
MVEVSRDGRYVTNWLYRAWDEQFYPDGVRGWLAKLDAAPGGGLALDAELIIRARKSARALCQGPPPEAEARHVAVILDRGNGIAGSKANRCRG